MAEHNTLTGSDLHEPKGAATAALGKAYIADGAGSGNWRHRKSGWGFYKDGGSAQVFNTTAAKLTNDGAGTGSSLYLPREIRGTEELFNTSTSDVTPIVLGDLLNIRLDLPVTADSGSPTELSVELDVSNGATPATVLVTEYVPLGRAAPYTVSLNFLVPAESDFVANGGQFFLTADTGTVTIDNPGILVSRVHGETN